MNRDLFLAILSMDSYNRGYGQSISNLQVPKFDADGNAVSVVKIGNATITRDSSSIQNSGNERQDIPAGFYAIAYDMKGVAGFADGERVIAYRGSDDFLGRIDFAAFREGTFGQGNDIKNGYGVAFGYPDGPQASLAIEFYRAVAGNDNDRDARLERPFHFAGERVAA